MELIQGEYIKIKQYLHKKKQCVSFEFALPYVEEGQTFLESLLVALSRKHLVNGEVCSNLS